MRIGVANDSAMAREVLLRIVRSAGEHTVAWVAEDGNEACRMAARRSADLILMDLVMPNLDGVEATRRIMGEYPAPILLVTSSLIGNSRMVYDALAAGALDAAQTPSLGKTGGAFVGRELLDKVAEIGRKFLGAEPPTPSLTAPLVDHLICIGASTGGPGALNTILASLEPDPSVAVVIVQHLDALFLPGLMDWLGQDSALPLRAAVSGERPRGGEAFLAMASDHLTLSRRGTFVYTPEPVDYPFRPSVDVLFGSVAATWPGRASGVLLTGMGSDGAKGLLAMRQAGHHTIAQDQDTSAVYGMPKAAATIDAAVQVLPIQEIGRALAPQTIPPRRHMKS